MSQASFKSWSTRHLQPDQNIPARLKEVLERVFKPLHLEITDQSHLHAGHGAKGAHFQVLIVSGEFQGKLPIERHKLVYAALKSEIEEEEIHALALKTLTPGEWNKDRTKAGNSK